MSKLRAFLQAERGRRRWSLTDLADKSGIPLSTLSRYEGPAHKGKPSHENVLKLSRVFGMEPGDILRYIGYPRHGYANGDVRDQEWAKLRGMIEADPRAQRMLALYDQASEEDKDLGVELLEVHFKKNHRPRRPE